MAELDLPTVDEIGPEAVVVVHDDDSTMRGILVVDCTVLGPCGGGTRMMPDLTVREVVELARSMTYKFGILGLPRGGSKAGIWGNPGMAPEKKQRVMRAFGRRLRPYLSSNQVAVGPDMGVTVTDVAHIYEGAGVKNARSGLFNRPVDGDSAAYHITGFGVAISARAALEVAGRSMEGATVAIEGFGQVGCGVARYAHRFGGRVVAISTLSGAIYDPDGLDVEELLRMRRALGDDCIVEYKGAQRIAPSSMYYLPVDVLVPGARPYVIDEANHQDVKAPVIVSGGNITTTAAAHELLFQKGVLSVPDFISNSGAAIASWVDFLAGDFDRALQTIERMIGPITRDVLHEASRTARNPYVVATERVRRRILDSKGTPPKSFEDIKGEIRSLFGM